MSFVGDVVWMQRVNKREAEVQFKDNQGHIHRNNEFPITTIQSMRHPEVIEVVNAERGTDRDRGRLPKT